MAQLSLLLTGADLTTLTEDNRHQVIYQNQTATPEGGTVSFPVEKDRIAAAVGADSPDGAALYLRLGGTGASSDSISVTYTEAAPTYGDLNGDGRVSTVDALMILRYCAGLAPLTAYQQTAADVVRTGTADTADAARILRYEARLESTLVVVPSQGG